MKKEQPLSKNIYNIKTAYHATIFYCIAFFICSAVISVQMTYTGLSFLATYFIVLFSLIFNYFIIFSTAFSKGANRKRFILVGLILFTISQLISNISILYGLDFSLQNISMTPSLISEFLGTAVYIIIFLLFLKTYKGGDTNRVKSNTTFILILLLLALYLYDHILNSSRQPEQIYIIFNFEWIFYTAALGVFCWVTILKIRNKSTQIIKIIILALLLVILTFYIFICYRSPFDIFFLISNFINSMEGPFVAYIAYKIISDRSYYKHFLEKHPKESN